MGTYTFMHENKRHYVTCSGTGIDSRIAIDVEENTVFSVQGFGNPEDQISIPDGLNGAAAHNYKTKQIKQWFLDWKEGKAIL